jgi:hypothetical protein
LPGLDFRAVPGAAVSDRRAGRAASLRAPLAARVRAADSGCPYNPGTARRTAR